MKTAHLSALLLTVALIGHAGTAWSQESLASISASTTPENQIYTPDYFTQFAPQTAADMVSRLPGFDIRGGEGGERGFGQATLNILINGRRPTSKSSGANQILRRIPASNVTRIEIVDGASLDIPGLSGQVANIIAKTGELSGSWDYAARFEEGSQPQLGDGSINFSAKAGRIEAVGSLDFRQFIFTEDGDETFFDGDGSVIQNRIEKLGFNNQRPGANLNLTYARDNGDIANLNVSGSRRNRNIEVSELFTDQTNAVSSGASRTRTSNDKDSFEISGDYSLDAPLLGQNGRLKLILLGRREALDLAQSFLFDDGAPGQSLTIFDREETTDEYIGRAEYTWRTGANSDWAFSIEGAQNKLDSDTLITIDTDTPTPANVRVKEDRLQTNLSRSWALNDRTNLQASVGAEYSEIDVLTGTEPAESFFRPKGFLSASYKLDDQWSLRSKIERSVGQLNFGTFVSTFSFAEGTANQGATRIVPQQNWDTELELEKQSASGLSGRAKIFYSVIEDQIEQILIKDSNGTPLEDTAGNLIQGPGNLDTNAQVYGVEANLTWVLDDFAKGLRLSANGMLADSSVKDPITQKNRSINGQSKWLYELEARWDIDGTPYAVEAEVEHIDRPDNFRIDEFIKSSFIRPEAELSLIHKDLLGMQWTVSLQNIVDFEFRRERFVFDETRNGDLTRREITKRQRGHRISFKVRDTF